MAYDFPNAPTIGQTYSGYTWDGEKWNSIPSVPNTAGVIGIQVFTASGTYTPSASMTTCVIECVGGGGAGGGATATATTICSAGGGGAGGWSQTQATAAQIGLSQTVTIGAGGLAGASGGLNPGLNGGDTSVGSICIAKGGGGGQGASSGSQPYGGLAGVAGTGTVVAAGATGVHGLLNLTNTTIVTLSGGGASSKFGGGARGVVGAGVVPGVTATGYGSGGSGGTSNASTSSTVGGAGSSGLVIITEYGMTALSGTATGAVRYDLPQGLTSTQMAQARQNIAAPLRGWIAGLTLSTAGASATFGVAVGSAADSTTSDLMLLASAYTKTTGTWAVGSGAGALDTGAIAAASWYHVFLIKRVDTGVVDVVVSATATPANGPTVMPAGYTLFRRIGSMKTAASLWIKFIQTGDEFLWDTPVQDMNYSPPNNTVFTAVLLSVPLGVRTTALLNAGTASGAIAEGRALVAPFDTTPAGVPSYSLGAYTGTVVGTQSFCKMRVRVNASGQIKAAVIAAGATIYLGVEGWLDRRGKDD